MYVFHIYNFKPEWQNQIIFKLSAKTKGKICLALVSKKKKEKHPKKYQESKSFIYKKQVFINWFI